MDAGGNPHVTYLDATNFDLMYAVGDVLTGVRQSLGSNLSLSVFPNPVAGGESRILYTVLTGIPIDLAIFEVSGRRVSTIVSETTDRRAGIATWTGLDAADRLLAPGVYFLRIAAGDRVETRRVTMIR